VRRLVAMCAVLSALGGFLLIPRVDGALFVLRADVRVSPSDDPDPRDETSLSVNPLDDRSIVGVSKVIIGGAAAGAGISRVAYYHSSDGGLTWVTSLLPLETNERTFTLATDPSVACDANGAFYICALMLDNQSRASGVHVFKSTNGGQTFSNPIAVTYEDGLSLNPKLNDKCYITVDASASSPFKNTIYAVWSSTDLDPLGSPRATMRFSYLRPTGTAFSQSRAISHEGDMRGGSITTGPNGEVYAAWEGIGSPKVILFNASTDGGVTFLPSEAAPGGDVNIHNFMGSLSPPNPTMIIQGVARMNSFPVIDCDRSNGPSRGMIYIVWAETSNRIDADVFIENFPPPNGARPTPNIPTRVTSIGFGDQFFPWVRVDSSSGSINVAYYDRRDSASGVNAYLSHSTDGGASFEDIKVSSAVTNPIIQADIRGANGSSIGIGDYIGLTANRGKTQLLWSDTRSVKQEIFFGVVDFGSTGGGPSTPFNDACTSPTPIAALPYSDSADTTTATVSGDDPQACPGTQGGNTVWYSLTPPADTVIGVDTAGSDYDTAVAVYLGNCGGLVPVACNDDAAPGTGLATRSLLTFPASAGIPYLIEVSGKTTGGLLKLRVGFPTVASLEYTTGPDGSASLRVTGSGFLVNNSQVIVTRDGDEIALPFTFYTGARQADGTVTELFGTRKKLKKVVPGGIPVIVRVESPVGSGRFSLPFTFVR